MSQVYDPQAAYQAEFPEGWWTTGASGRVHWWQWQWNNDQSWGHIYFNLMVPAGYTNTSAYDRSPAVYMSNGAREEYFMFNHNGVVADHGNRFASIDFTTHQSIAAGYYNNWMHVYLYNNLTYTYNLFWSPYPMGYTVNGQNLVAFGDFSYGTKTSGFYMKWISYDLDP